MFLGYIEVIAILVYITHLIKVRLLTRTMPVSSQRSTTKRSLLDYYIDDTKVPGCLGCMHLLSVRLFKTLVWPPFCTVFHLFKWEIHDTLLFKTN
jgi:hypothetical protein